VGRPVPGGNQNVYSPLPAAPGRPVQAPPVTATQPQPPITATQPQPPPAAAGVTARTVKALDLGSSALVKLAGQYWGELDKAAGKIVFVFEETQRTDTEVLMIDRARGVQLRVSIADLTVYYGSDGAAPSQPMFTIKGGSDVSRVPGSNVAWDTQIPPADLLPQQQAAAPPPVVLQPHVAPAPQSLPPQSLPPQPAAVTSAPGNDPARAFAPDMYAMSMRQCSPKKVVDVARAATKLQTLGACSPVRTEVPEFVASYIAEEMSFEVKPPTGFASIMIPGASFRLTNNPDFQAWVDDQGHINIAVSTNKTRIAIENAINSKQLAGPFFRSMTVTVKPSMNAQVQSTFPLNGMGSSNASRSVGFNISASIGANAGSPAASGLNAGISAGVSDTTTTSTQLDEYKVIVRNGATPSERVFDWYLCAWGPLSECYKGGSDLLVRGILGAVMMELVPLPNSAFRIDGFKSDVYYKITDTGMKRRLQTEHFDVTFDYTIVFNSVFPNSKDHGILTAFGQTQSASVNHKMIFRVNVKELANIVFANPGRYGIN
jgi:hypothetical protein